MVNHLFPCLSSQLHPVFSRRARSALPGCQCPRWSPERSGPRCPPGCGQRHGSAGGPLSPCAHKQRLIDKKETSGLFQGLPPSKGWIAQMAEQQYIKRARVRALVQVIFFKNYSKVPRKIFPLYVQLEKRDKIRFQALPGGDTCSKSKVGLRKYSACSE